MKYQVLKEKENTPFDHKEDLYAGKSCFKTGEPTTDPWTRRRRRVAFGRIEIKEYPYQLGDNPSVSDGAPLTIAWEPQSTTVFEVESYEAYHPSSARRRVKGKHDSGLKLSVARRAEM